jgi:hypothetical protein
MRDYKKETLFPNTKVLSGSQVLDYAKDPADFHTKWVLGVEGGKSPALMFGLIFSEAYADRKYDFLTACKEHKINSRLVSLLQKVLPLFPVLPNPKKNCEHELKIKLDNGWTIRVTLDGFLPTQATIIENKTGQMMWTQEVCDTHPQLTLQQWAVWKKTGKLAKKHFVNWVDTSTQATKLIHSFQTKRTMAQLKEFEVKLYAIVEGIEIGNFTVKRYFW